MNLPVPLYLNEENITLHSIPGDLSFKAFFHLIDECAKKDPNSTAIKFNNICWSYQAISEYSNKLAKHLMGNGIQKGDVIGLAMDRSAEMIISLLAILKSGAAYVPLDPSYPKDRIEFMISDSSATLLLTSKKYQSYFVSNVAELLIEDAWAKLDRYGPSGTEIQLSSGNLAYVLYTSGSTGKPKGVLITHGSLANFLYSMQKLPGIAVNDRLLAISTISFDIAGFELYLPLISGAQIVLASAEIARDGWLLLELIKKENITILQATPYTWRMLIAAGWDERLPLKAITGGEPLTKDLALKLIPRCSELWNQYGPTETTVYSTQKLITSADDISIGKPIDNTQVYILDESLHRLDVGATGEIYIGGMGVANGYLNRQELTEERFVDDLYSGKHHSKMYRTGDLGRLTTDGEIQCLGRADQQVKVRGFRIELEEIEYELLKAKGVKEAVVTVRTDNPEDSRIAAYIVQASGGGIKLSITDLKQKLSAVLPAYMVPDDFVLVTSIPITPNGKIDRKALPRPEVTLNETEKNYSAPTTEMEKQLTKIWEEFMGIDNISIQDNFFSLGGHSLVAVQIMTRIKKITGNRLPIAAMLKYPTIKKLASHLDAGDSSNEWTSLVALRSGGSKSPLYIIHGEGLNVLYFNDLVANMDNDQPVYGLQARGLKGDEPLEVLEEIAANYVEEIIDQNPGGPYLLAGYSFGGYVAVEMRKQMIALGKDVRLIIIDTDADMSEYKGWWFLAPRKIKRHFPTKVSQLKPSIVYVISILLNKVKNLHAQSAVEEESKDFYRQIKRIKDKLRLALRNYSMEPFDDKIDLYKSKICTYYPEDQEFLGWKKYAKKGVKIHEVPGDHLSMLLHPHVVQFAIMLQQGIDKLITDKSA